MPSPTSFPLCRSTAAVAAITLALSAPVFGQLPPVTPPAQAGNEILDNANARPGRPTPTYTMVPGITIPPGPVKLSWDSVKENFRVPAWLQDGKFGIFIHWGPYTVAAHHNEWYPKHMYGNGGIIKWHQENFGPQDKFGYKDLIPLFKAEKFDPVAWADLFKKAGATFVIPTGEHHDRFAMWDSKLTKWDAKEMGPKRDIIGELGKAVRADGMKFGISNHRMFGYDFMVPQKGLKTDLYDPAYADFYGPLPKEPKTLASQEFAETWLARTIELIDTYQPDFLWFDWDGTGAENPIKLQFAAYYFNRAKEWGKEVAISQKGNTFPEGTGISSHEKGGRMPKEITSNVWMVDDVISTRSWSYVTGMQYRSATSIIQELVNAVSRNGTMMLNISPRADGVIPPEQQDILLAVGKWLGANGEAIYGTRPWKQATDSGDVRYTKKADTLYATLLKWPKQPITLGALTKEKVGDIKGVSLLGPTPKAVSFKQTPEGLVLNLPSQPAGDSAWALKITGARL